MKSLLASFAALAFSVTAAQAAIIDFAAQGAANPGALPQGSTQTYGSIVLTINANPADPYLDAYFNGKPGGLGACYVIVKSPQFCDPTIANNSDNVGAGESLTFTFNKGVDISNLSFNAANHTSLNNSSRTLLVNGVEWTFANLFLATLTGVKSLNLAFGGSNASQFYVSAMTAVPIPAAAPLLLSGLAGLGFAARRRRKTA